MKNNFPISFFHKVAKESKGYKDFLKKNKVDPKKIRTLSDFTKNVPVMEKDNYLRAYPLSDIVLNNKIPPVVSASSGSSGKPYYWPRGNEQEIAGGKLHQHILCDIFKIGKKKTLIVVCFSMGNWIAGTFTAASCRYIADQKGINLSIITPGIEREDILSIIRDFAPQFETVIIAGYPPFVMDIISEANRRSIPLNTFSLKFLFAGENFSENWRSSICDAASIDNIPENTISVYGSADAGALGHENPLTILIRKLSTKNKKFCQEFFGEVGFVPSLVQYNPNTIYFEIIDNQIAFTSPGGIPLIRYNIKDQGRIINQKTVIDVFKSFNLYNEFKDIIKIWNKPMVALYGRSDVTVTFYALNIYPENIKAGIEDKSFSNLLSGKFIANVEHSNDQIDQKLIITFELNPSVVPDEFLLKAVKSALFESLTNLNAEFRKLHSSIKEKAVPEIKFAPNGDPLFTIKKAKHSWVDKKIS